MSIPERRKKIDKIDEKILDLITQRANVVKEIGNLKTKDKEGYYVPSREYDIYKRLAKKNNGPLKDESVKAIFREIMSASLALEKPLKISFFGPEASFTHLAAQSKFGSSVEYIEEKNIADVFASVEKSRSDYGVVPIENSTEGIVNHTLDMFVDSELQICSEIMLQIEHNLLANCALKNIKKIYSHPQPIGQCRLWLESNCPNVEVVETSSTSRAAELAAKEKNSAAIASRLASQKYNIKIVRSGIQDKSDNVTRFLVIGNHGVSPTGHDKTSIMFSVKDKVGVLYSILSAFKESRINLTKIESRPSKKKIWEYIFFVDFIGHQQKTNAIKTLAKLKKNCIFLKILGSYPMLP